MTTFDLKKRAKTVVQNFMANFGDFSSISANYLGIEAGEYVERICRILAEQEWIYNFQLTRFFLERVWEKVPEEVSYLASVVRDTCGKTSCSSVIDVGSGLGYLGQVLHHQCGLQVVGVEAQASHVHGAQRRVKSQGEDKETQIQTMNLKLDDNPSSIRELELLISSLQQSPSEGQSQSQNGDIHERDNGTCMVGLHCCGDLCPIMLKMFTSVERLRCLVCVSCCYHGMSVTDTDSRPSCFKNFPLSCTVQEKLKEVGRDFPDWQLNVFALRLAAQETRARWACQSYEDHQFHTRSVAYRAILEHVVSTAGKGIQKLKRKVTRKDAFQSFPVYLAAVFGRLTLHSDEVVQTEEDWKKYHDALQQSHDQWEEYFPYIEVITALQVLLQPVLETLVTVDRCLYLHEQGLKTEVVPIFDDSISPRNLVIIAER
uniref:Methyltransferase domain-containing protein n=1 Tax=Branchiostoma floridae TaxID=7739 RepID=C3YDM3_BRAFL|eukprot:XP_002605482.1 hypothetical protein BRAFLDRAFT_92900 [Branchiostoma floridae]